STSAERSDPHPDFASDKSDLPFRIALAILALRNRQVASDRVAGGGGPRAWLSAATPQRTHPKPELPGPLPHAYSAFTSAPLDSALVKLAGLPWKVMSPPEEACPLAEAVAKRSMSLPEEASASALSHLRFLPSMSPPELASLLTDLHVPLMSM